MIAVPFKTVLWGVARKMGYDPAESEFTDETAAKYTDFINERLREGIEHAFWPELTPVEQRAYRDVWAIGTSYTAGDEVFYEDTEEYYQALLDNSGQDPTTTTGYWTDDFTLDKYIPYEQTGKTPLGEVKGTFRKNPRTNRNYPGEIGFEPSDNGIQLGDYAGAQTWIEFRIRPPEFTSDVWSDTSAYVTDDLVYLAATGECYKALQNSTDRNPATETAFWAVVEFPKLLAKYVVRHAYADALDEDGQQDKSLKEEDRAYNELLRVETIVFKQQRQSHRSEFRGYPS